jgi:hypothetical protein
VTPKLRAADPGSDNYSLQASFTGNQSHYVQDNNPVAETQYHVRFWFSPNGSLTSTSANVRNQAVTIFQAWQAANGSNAVLSIQFQRTSAGLYQLRAVDAGSGLATSWQTLTNAAHSVVLDWIRGAGSGGLVLTIDGSATTLSGLSNVAKSIEVVQLGIVSGSTSQMSNANAGALRFDAFGSTHTTKVAS